MLFQAVVVWLGREESCRVSLGSLCPSDPTAMLIFASPSGSFWLLSQCEKHVNTPFSSCKHFRYSPAWEGPSPREETPLYTLLVSKTCRKYFLKNRKNRNRLLPCINIMQSGVRLLSQWLWCWLESEEPGVCVNMDILAILSREISTLVNEENRMSVWLDSQCNVNTVFPT